jgi:hypothetical protein
VLSLLTVQQVKTFGLSKLVSLSGSKTSEDLLSSAMRDLLAVPALFVLESLEALKGGGAGDEFVREVSLKLKSDNQRRSGRIDKWEIKLTSCSPLLTSL